MIPQKIIVNLSVVAKNLNVFWNRDIDWLEPMVIFENPNAINMFFQTGKCWRISGAFTWTFGSYLLV
jgi:hypothetical protein